MGRNTAVPIILTTEQRETLTRFTTTGTHSVRIVNRARVILALDTSEDRKPKKQMDISAEVGVSHVALINIKRDFLEAETVDKFLQRKERDTPPRKPKIDGELEAHIIAMACGNVPEGHAKWTVRLIAEKCVELDFVDSISPVTVHRLLKKLRSSRT
jgi:hypothetical protein